ncbi:MAG: retroviral-like aspartic protease family protein [bacterium]
MGKVIERVKMWNVWEEEQIKEGRSLPLEVEAIIDTGATRVLLPIDLVKRLGLKFSGRTKVRYADGRIEEKDVAFGLRIEILGRDTESMVVIEKEGVKPLLGQIVLEDTDLLVDCKTGKVIPNPASPDMPLLEEL